jgi:hypothetical protein
MRIFEATVSNGETVEVRFLPCGSDFAITLNGVPMRSLYDPTEVESCAINLVEVRYGKVLRWESHASP